MFARTIAIILASLFALGGLSAAAQPVDGGYATVELISERTEVRPGETVYFALDMKLDEHWHVYWRNAGDAGLPPKFIADKDGALTQDQIGDFVWPVPHLLPITPDVIMDYGYDDEVVFAFPITIPDDAWGEFTVSGLADYLICEEVCVPEAVNLSLTLPVGITRPDEANGRRIAEWIAKAPSDLSGEATVSPKGVNWALSISQPGAFAPTDTLRFFPHNHEIRHAAKQTFSFGDKGATLLLTPDGEGEPPAKIEGVVVVENAAGARLGYTVSAKAGPPLADTSGKRPAGPSSNLLLMAGFALLGGLILNLMPCVLPVLTIKAMGMVSAAASGNANELRSHGLWYTGGVLVSFGVLAGAIVAVREATGSATLGFQLQHAPTVAILALIMFAIGLWLLGMFELGGSIQNTGNSLASRSGAVGAFFTGVLAAVVGAPCVGPFLGVALGAVMSQPAPSVFLVFLAMGFGLALPFLLLSFVPNLQRLLPKPGAWMETLKQAFAFPMFLTAAWLLSVLGALAGNGAAAWTAVGATIIAFAIWLAGKGGGPMKAVAALALIAGFAVPALRANVPPPPIGTSTAYAAKYETEAWSTARVAELVAEGRPVFVDFTATWCATCQVNKTTTLRTQTVQDAFAKNDVAFLVADFTRNDPLIAEEIRLRGRAGVPMYLWYASGSDEPEILPEILSRDMILELVNGG